MNKYVKFMVSFLICTICFFFLAVGILGPSGYLYNRSLAKILYSIQYDSNKALYELDNLKEYQQYLTSDQAVRDNAISLGYYVQGDNVFIITNGQLQNPVEIQQEKFDFKPFETLSYLKCLAIASGVSLIINLIILASNKDMDKQTNDDRKEISETDYNDDLLKE